MSEPVEKPPWRATASRVWRVFSWVIILVLLFVVYRRVSPRIDLEEAHGTAPEFELLDTDGQLFRLSDHHGSVIVLNFWATWCPPCIAEIPGFVDLQDEFRDDGVLFVGVSLDEGGAEAVGPFIERRGVNYPVLLDGFHAASLYDGVPTLPTTYLIDRNGEIRFRHEGLLLKHALRPALRSLAGERGS